MSGYDALVDGNDFFRDAIMESLRLAADFIDGGAARSERLEFRLLLADFDVDTDTLSTEHRDLLDQMLSIGRRFRSSLRIWEVVGRASRTGTEANNIALSERRATAVTSYLLLNGFSKERLGEVRAVGSSEPVADVGPVEEAFNRSVEVCWSFDYVAQLPPINPAQQWTVHLGQDVGWTFMGQQKLTLSRVDTGQSRRGTFNYVDASFSVSPISKIIGIMQAKRLYPGQTPEDLVDLALEAMPEQWQNFVARVAFDAATGLSVMPADTAAPVPVVNARPLAFEEFEGPAFLLIPWSLETPAGSVGQRAQLVFGWPEPIATALKAWDASPGFASLFPDLSVGVKVGYFELD